VGKKEDGKSHMSKDKSHKSENYEEKTVEDIEVEIDKLFVNLDQNNVKLDKIRKAGRLKSEMKIKEEQKPFIDHNRYIRQRIELLDKMKNAKIPYYDKIPKDSNFYKFIINKLLTTKLVTETRDKAREEKASLKDVNDKILNPTLEFAEI
jgi:hypothetical protein